QLVAPELPELVCGHAALLQCASHGIQIDATSVIAANEAHAPAAPADLEPDASARGLAHCAALHGALDAMCHGVADQLGQSGARDLEQMRIQTHLTPFGLERDLFAQSLSGV